MTHRVALVYDKMETRVECQILRDLLALSSRWDLAVIDPAGQMSTELLAEIGIPVEEGSDHELQMIYKVGREYPARLSDVSAVERDLEIRVKRTTIHPTSGPGYYLKEQGRDGANLTELYLNRTAPRGNGLSDALVVLLWG